jgi:uncharacterized membrane protein
MRDYNAQKFVVRYLEEKYLYFRANAILISYFNSSVTCFMLVLGFILIYALFLYNLHQKQAREKLIKNNVVIHGIVHYLIVVQTLLRKSSCFTASQESRPVPTKSLPIHHSLIISSLDAT